MSRKWNAEGGNLRPSQTSMIGLFEKIGNRFYPFAKISITNV